ncbi:MAG: hypothetical protein ACI9SC_000492 [Gammaproteobacteria bacterium]|jgi:hypothetical protein
MLTKKPKGIVSIQHLLDENNGTLAALYKHTAQLQVYQEKLKTTLPPPLCDHFILANIDADSLTLHTDSSAWAARLRFKTLDILSTVRELCKVDYPHTLRIKVVLPANKPIKPKKRTLKLSSKNAQLIQDTANSITDPVLRDALLRLSQHNS